MLRPLHELSAYADWLRSRRLYLRSLERRGKTGLLCAWRQSLLGRLVLRWKTILNLSHSVARLGRPGLLHLGRLHFHVHRRVPGDQASPQTRQQVESNSQVQRWNLDAAAYQCRSSCIGASGSTILVLFLFFGIYRTCFCTRRHHTTPHLLAFRMRISSPS